MPCERAGQPTAEANTRGLNDGGNQVIVGGYTLHALSSGREQFVCAISGAQVFVQELFCV